MQYSKHICMFLAENDPIFDTIKIQMVRIFLFDWNFLQNFQPSILKDR